jgi:glyoxylase-like metal-dependent hydrolase (beta-lactamase superfamily II)
MKPHIIDLEFLEANETIACFLIESTQGLLIVETGPASTVHHLKKGVESLGYTMEDIQHVFLTHIHFDHAGAAWKFAKHGAKIYVHPKGLPHLAAPEKLWNSAAQIYGSEMERLWGKMEPIDEDLLIAVNHQEIINIGNISIKAIHTPGHAVHHIAWQIEEMLFTGDVAGVSIKGGPVVPPCPPPDIHLEDWKESIALILASSANILYLTHYGKVENKVSHLNDLIQSLEGWSQWMKKRFESGEEIQSVIPKFMEFTKNDLRIKGCDEEMIQLYEYANPSWMSVSGLMRYWKQKSLGKI